jgi:pimeloyl-ACP methyl ester carboxylesterase
MMAQVVGIHGAFHQLWGPHQVASRWLPAIRDGLWHHDAGLRRDDFAVAFYGDLFRHSPETGRPDRSELMEVASRSGFLDHLYDEFGEEGIEILADLVGRETVRVLVDQVARYFANDDLRAETRGRMERVVTDDTRVVMAHSMGTIVAYETLARHPEWAITTLITLGSPLGNTFVFESLDSAGADTLGAWPGSVVQWINVAAVDDPVIDQPRLSSCFGRGVEDVLVDNGRDAHRVEPYLNARETGSALAEALGLS